MVSRLNVNFFSVPLRPYQLPVLQPLDEPGALDEGRGDASDQGGACLVPCGPNVSQCSTWHVQCSYLATWWSPGSLLT